MSCASALPNSSREMELDLSLSHWRNRSCTRLPFLRSSWWMRSCIDSFWCDLSSFTWLVVRRPARTRSERSNALLTLARCTKYECSTPPTSSLSTVWHSVGSSGWSTPRFWRTWKLTCGGSCSSQLTSSSVRTTSTSTLASSTLTIRDARRTSVSDAANAEVTAVAAAARLGSLGGTRPVYELGSCGSERAADTRGGSGETGRRYRPEVD